VEGLLVEHAEVARPGERLSELVDRQALGQIDERSRRRGHADAVECRHVVGVQRGREADRHAGIDPRLSRVIR